MADETPAPLSDAEIAEATRRIDFAQRQGTDTPATVNIIRRLLATLAAYREIVAAVATANPYGSWYPATSGPAGVVCRWCMERATSPQQCQHDAECTWIRARALLATQTPATGATAGETVCELCGGTGIYVGDIAWENPDGTIGAETKRTTCHGCNGTGKRKASVQTAGEE